MARGDAALSLSRRLLTLSGTQVTVHHRGSLPTTGSLVVISNHRSVLDVPLLMTALGRPIRFACHHFMGQVPGLKQTVSALGCVPLDVPGEGPQAFFRQANQFLQAGESVGLFPEGAYPMVQPLGLQQVGTFQRGVAHLALQAPVEQLAIIPIAIAVKRETIVPVAPFQLFQWLAPSEPLFNRSGWHPAAYYHQVHVIIGQPILITNEQRTQYRGKSAGAVAQAITQDCRSEIANLLQM